MRDYARLVLLATTAFGIGVLVFMLSRVNLADTWQVTRHLPASELLACLGLTGLSFAGLGLFDVLAVAALVPGRVRRRLAWLAGAGGSAIANTVGVHVASGSAVRASLYLPAGLAAADVASVISLSWLSALAGNLALLAAAEICQGATRHAASLHLAAGLVLTALLASALAWLRHRPRRIELFRLSIPLPSSRFAFALILIGAIESGAAIGALFVLLPSDLAPSFDRFAVDCLIAVALGLASHTPGGIGVFEASMIHLLGGQGRPDLLAALLAYRLIYNVLPFLLAVMVVVALASRRQLSASSQATRPAPDSGR